MIYTFLCEMVIFLYNLYIFVWIQQDYLANKVFALDLSSIVIKRLCIFLKTAIKTYVVDTHKKCCPKMLQNTTHNVFKEE